MRATRDLFLRALGLVFFCAFASWWWQQPGLIGAHGIAPAAEYLQRVRASSGSVGFLDLPTLLLFTSASDAVLSAVAAGGTLASLLLALGLLPLPSLLGCWLLYLSLVLVGGPFMQFQWDSLLLEAGAMALVVCPLALRLGPGARQPHLLAVLLLRWLLFRLMLLAGWVKLASGDPVWRDLSALDYHYFTQPLPTFPAWLSHQLPPSLHKAQVAIMLAIELGSPWFVFAPRTWRIRLALVPIVGLMALIAATGNYGFFNLLTVVLCIPLLDDETLARWARRPFSEKGVEPPLPRPLALLRAALLVAAALLVLTVSVGEIGVRMLHAELPSWQQQLMGRVAPFRSINSYGLFATMTTERKEIALEGSLDGERYRPYRFRHKPGPLDGRPRFVGPHMPRLDWQMWFAALGTCRGNPWFLAFQKRLLEGAPEVSALLEEDPFAEGPPPRFLRTPLGDYHFSTVQGLRREGRWWTREPEGDYCPELTLVDGQLSRRER